MDYNYQPNDNNNFTSGNMPENGNTVNLNKDVVKEAKKLFSRVGFRLLIATVALFGICFGIQALIAWLKPEWFFDYTSSLLISLVPQYLIGMPAMVAILYSLPHKAPEKRKVGFGWGILFFMMAYAIMYIANLTATMLNLAISSASGNTISTYAVQEFVSNSNIIVVTIATVICAPIFEELIFRKMIIDRCGTYGEAASALVSGLAFGLFHNNLTQGIYAFCLGYFFALIYNKCGKIHVTIIIHMVINFMGSFIAVNLTKLVDLDALGKISLTDTEALMAFIEENIVGFLLLGLYGVFVMGVVIAGIVLTIVHRRKLLPKPGVTPLPKGKTFSTVMFNPGMQCFFWVLMAYIVYNFIGGLR